MDKESVTWLHKIDNKPGAIVPGDLVSHVDDDRSLGTVVSCTRHGESMVSWHSRPERIAEDPHDIQGFLNTAVRNAMFRSGERDHGSISHLSHVLTVELNRLCAVGIIKAYGHCEVTLNISGSIEVRVLVKTPCGTRKDLSVGWTPW